MTGDYFEKVIHSNSWDQLTLLIYAKLNCW